MLLRWHFGACCATLASFKPGHTRLRGLLLSTTTAYLHVRIFVRSATYNRLVLTNMSTPWPGHIQPYISLPQRTFGPSQAAIRFILCLWHAHPFSLQPLASASQSWSTLGLAMRSNHGQLLRCRGFLSHSYISFGPVLGQTPVRRPQPYPFATVAAYITSIAFGVHPFPLAPVLTAKPGPSTHTFLTHHLKHVFQSTGCPCSVDDLQARLPCLCCLCRCCCCAAVVAAAAAAPCL